MASRALIIGPHSYAKNSGLAAHDTIGQSARMYAEVLKGDPMWGPNRVSALPEDELATIDGVMAGVEKAAGEAKSGDILLVVYIGHGKYWADVPGGQVHFAVNNSRMDVPYTWLSSWYLYRAMRRSQAALKVLIADCCYSNLLPHLGDGGLVLPGALGIVHKGTCVLTAVENTVAAQADGCSELPAEFAACTPFSGHLLKVLSQGTRDHKDQLNLGLILDAVVKDLSTCGTHPQPGMSLNGAREAQPLFTNRMAVLDRQQPLAPRTVDEWVNLVLKEQTVPEGLLADAELAGKVVARLWSEADADKRRVAGDINDKATKSLTDTAEFAKYWSQVDPVYYA